MRDDLNDFLRTVWWIAHVLLLSLAPQGVTLGLVRLLLHGLVSPYGNVKPSEVLRVL